MLLLYRNRGRLVPTTFIFSVTKHPNLWGPSGESVSWETRVFFGVEVGKGVYLQHEFPAIFLCFWTKPMIMGVRVPVYEKQVIFFWFRPFFFGRLFVWEPMIGSCDVKHLQKRAKVLKWRRIGFQKSCEEMMGTHGTHFFGHRFTLYFWRGFGASSILFQRFFDETMRQISTDSHIICIYIYIYCFYCL